MGNNHLLELENVTMDYGETVALNNVSMYIRQNEFLTLLGPSGCGKTTMLRIIAGFETPSSGRVLFDGQDMASVPPYRRHVNTVFQRYALFPHLNVFENIAFGLKLKKMDKAVISERVKSMLRLVNLSGYEKRSIDALSGGQQQRVAIARALVNQPEMLLLDEPLGALDLKLRKEMQLELKAMQQRLGITFLYVTHDQEEALTMSDTIAVMRDGEIQQIGTPIDIYNEPKNAYVADFVGESNIIDGVMEKDYLVRFCGHAFPCLDAGFAPDEDVDVVVRPEDVVVTSEEAGTLRGEVRSIVFMGVHYEIRVGCGDFEWLIHTTRNAEVGDRVGLRLDPDAIHIMHKGEKPTCSSAQ